MKIIQALAITTALLFSSLAFCKKDPENNAVEQKKSVLECARTQQQLLEKASPELKAAAADVINIDTDGNVYVKARKKLNVTLTDKCQHLLELDDLTALRKAITLYNANGANTAKKNAGIVIRNLLFKAIAND